MPRTHIQLTNSGAWLALGLGLATTLAASLLVASYARVDARNAFHFYCDEIKLKALSRLEGHKQVLLGGAALFDASTTVERHEWRNYAQRLQLDQSFKGIQGFGFALAIPKPKLNTHIAQVRANGFPRYSVWPGGARDFYSSIIYLEPFKDRNLRAFGYDMYSEPVRQEAMARARDQNVATLTGKVHLVQETGEDIQAGTLMYVPVYSLNAPIRTIEERRSALVGWVYSPFRMKDLLAGLLSDSGNITGELIRMRVYDGISTNSTSLLYDSMPDAPLSSTNGRVERQMNIHGVTWTMSFELTDQVALVIDYAKAYMTFGAGLLASLLLFFLVRSLQNTQLNAQRIAANLTIALQKKVEAERNLSEKLQLQSAALEASANAIMITDPEGVIIWVNSSFTRLTGYSKEEALGAHPEALSRSGEHESDFYNQLWKKIKSKNIWHGELINRRKDGTRYHEEMTITPVTDKRGNIQQYVAIKQDISQRKQAEALIKESEERLRFALDATGEGLWDWDIATNRVSHNSRWCELLGLDSHRLVNDLDVFTSHLHPDDKDAVMQRIQSCLENGTPYISEHRMIKADGGLIWVLDRGQVVSRSESGRALRMVGSIADVTMRKLAQDAQAASEGNLRQILANSPEGVLALSVTNVLTFHNEQLKSMLALDQVFGLRLPLDGFLAQLEGRISAKDLQTLKHGLQSSLQEGSFKLLSPKRIIRWESRELVSSELHTILFFRDVTKDVEIDEMKSDFLATAAHELRAPMSSIYGFVELMLTRTPTQDERQEYLQIVYDQTKSLIKMLNELLDLSRIEARAGRDFKFVPSNIGAIVYKTLLELNIPPDTHPVLIDRETSDWPPLMIDEEKIKQVFINVISNAYKYSPAGGQITITHEIEDKDGMQWLSIKVSDHGIGMTKEQSTRAFDRFYRANTYSDIPGTGLGLALVKEIVEIHGGVVSMDSRLGEGTDCILRFPVDPELKKGDMKHER